MIDFQTREGRLNKPFHPEEGDDSMGFDKPSVGQQLVDLLLIVFALAVVSYIAGAFIGFITQ